MDLDYTSPELARSTLLLIEVQHDFTSQVTGERLDDLKLIGVELLSTADIQRYFEAAV